MTAALKLTTALPGETIELSPKPRLGEKVSWQVSDWEKTAANDCCIGEKPEAKVRWPSGEVLYAYVHNNPLYYIDPKGLNAGAAAGAGAVLFCMRYPSVCAAGAVALCRLMGLCEIPDGMMNEDASDDAEPQQCPPKGKESKPPFNGPPNGYEEGPRRGREYGPDGTPIRDYDNPHQGADYPHVHEWPDGVREHPGRPYSPIPKE